MTSFLAARYHRCGRPGEALEVDQVTVAPPRKHEVTVGMFCAPINPADLNMIEGKYGEARDLPDVPGSEGCGRVVAVGAGVDGAWVGRKVLVDGQAWRESGNWPLDRVVAVPDGLAADHAAVLRVNPPTAWLLLHQFAALQPGDWVLQNAATSAVGRAVIEIAHQRGWKTLNVVRRAAAAEELRALGADAVVVDDEDMGAAAQDVLGGAVPRLALNAIGGESATRLAGLLASGGTLVTYGAMSKEALKIPNSFLIFRDLVFRGFWLTRWLRAASPDQVSSLFDQIFRLAASGCFAPRVVAEFPLAEVGAAVTRAEEGGGKVLLRIGG
jgi:trans-2-enoyl-CoA reductase